MNFSFPNSDSMNNEKELNQVNSTLEPEETIFNLFNEDDFFIKDDSQGSTFIFKCSFNEMLWDKRDYLDLSADLSFPGCNEEKIKQIPLSNIPFSTLSLQTKKSLFQIQKKQNQRQEITLIQAAQKQIKIIQKKKLIKKKSKSNSIILKKSKSKRDVKSKRDNNYVMKRAHTVLKKCCWSVDKNLRTLTREDADGSMDYFVRLLCRVEAIGHLYQIVQKYHQETQYQINKIQTEIENEQSQIEITHLNNVIAVLLKGKQAANIFISGDRVQAMEIMYGKGKTLKKEYKMQKAIQKLNTLLIELNLGDCKSKAIPDIQI